MASWPQNIIYFVVVRPRITSCTVQVCKKRAPPVPPVGSSFDWSIFFINQSEAEMLTSLSTRFGVSHLEQQLSSQQLALLIENAALLNDTTILLVLEF